MLIVDAPVQVRPPTAVERPAIVRSVRRHPCAPQRIRVSTVDSRYATVEFGFCPRANGFLVVRRFAAGWRVVSGGSDIFPCADLGERVTLSLFGECYERRDWVSPILDRSPGTLLYYRAALWWGAPGRVGLNFVRRDGAWTAAKITAPHEHQWVFLNGRRLVASDCEGVPPAVVHRLVGSCHRVPPLWAIEVVGPTYRRRPTAAERRGILAHCGRSSVEVWVSRLDPRYATTFSCYGSGAVSLYHRGPNGWRETSLEIDGFSCTEAPPGIIRSVHGRCILGT